MLAAAVCIAAVDPLREPAQQHSVYGPSNDGLAVVEAAQQQHASENHHGYGLANCRLQCMHCQCPGGLQ